VAWWRGFTSPFSPAFSHTKLSKLKREKKMEQTSQGYEIVDSAGHLSIVRAKEDGVDLYNVFNETSQQLESDTWFDSYQHALDYW
jgi:hypothetical protein